jgi:hypothetical protein
MDPKLAEIYGTNDADLEKLAAAELAEGLANDEQLDTDGMTEEDLEAIAQDVLSASAEGEEEAEAAEGEAAPEQEKTSAAEAQEKLAEADYLGRVMAHSYVNELRELEKTAGPLMSRINQAGRAVSGAVKGQVKDVAQGFKNLGHEARHPIQAAKGVKEMVGTYGV